MLRKLRIAAAVVCFTLVTLLFLDFTGTLHAWFGWLARIQFLPALLAVNVGVVAALVVIVDQVLKAYTYDVSKALSVFIGLIITNCIIMGRLEAFALNNTPWASFLDGVGNGLGYGIILVIVSFFRELLGSGTLFGCQIFPQAWYEAGYMNNGLMILPPMALIVVGCIIWVHRSFNKDLQE